MSFKEKNTFTGIFVVDYNVNILGWLEEQKLNRMINPCQRPYVFSIQEDDLETILKEFKGVFNKQLGCLRDFEHQIVLKSNAYPVKQRIRNIPLSARAKVRTILENWSKDGIIKPINASEWLPPVVIAKKRIERSAYA